MEEFCGQRVVGRERDKEKEEVIRLFFTDSCMVVNTRLLTASQLGVLVGGSCAPNGLRQ